MGNFCCLSSNPCDHTVDETKGLLSSSESKTSTRADGQEGTGFSQTEVAQGRKNEESDKEVVTSQPNAIHTSVQQKSAYCSVINSLHTEESRAVSQNSSPEVFKEPVEASVEKAEGKENVGTEETQTAAEHKDVLPDPATPPLEIVTAEDELKKETQIDDVPINVDESVVATLTVQEEAIKAPLDTSKMGIEKEAAEACIKKEDAVADMEMGEAQANVEKEGAAVQKEEAQENVEKQDAEVDMEKKDVEADAEQDTAEVIKKKEESEVDIEKDKPKTSMEKDELALNSSTGGEHEVEHLVPIDVEENNKAGTSVTESRKAEPETSLPATTSEVDVVEKSVFVVSSVVEVKEGNLTSEIQENSEELNTLAMEMGDELIHHNIENGQEDDLKDKNPSKVDDTLVSEMPQEIQLIQKCNEPSFTEMETPLIKNSNNVISLGEEVDESRDSAAERKKIPVPNEKEAEFAESLLNGLDSTPAEKSEPTEAHSDTLPVENIEFVRSIEAISLDDHKEEKEPINQLREEYGDITSVVQETVAKDNTEGHKVQKGEIILSSSHAVEVALIPLTESVSEKEEQEPEDEDLYRGAEEIEIELTREKQSKPLLEFTIPGVEEKCSLAAAVDILAYSESEWKGNTAKSTLIRKGYSEMSCSFSSLRRVRGDNYCALRATLYQVLATTKQTPSWLLEENFTSLPEKLEAQEHLIGEWKFPSQCWKVGQKEDAVQKMKHYLELLQKRWQTAAESESLEEKQHVCESVFQGAEEEYGLLEVLKFLMLARAVELHGKMHAGQEVPMFCWLLFARDTSENPKTLLSNHLGQIGFTGGLEQVEMFLLGYALQHTIQTFRLYMTDTEEFVTHYPDDHKQDWPCVCIVTEDDRHYNVPIRKQAQHQLNHDLSVLWPDLS